MTPYEKFCLAQTTTDSKILEELSNDILDIIRYNVYQNIYTPVEIRERLEKDPEVKRIIVRLHMV